MMALITGIKSSIRNCYVKRDREGRRKVAQSGGGVEYVEVEINVWEKERVIKRGREIKGWGG